MNTLVQLSAVVNIVAIVLLLVLVHGIYTASKATRAATKERDSRYTQEELAQYVLEAYRQGITECATLYKQRQGLQGTDGYISSLRDMYKEAAVDSIVWHTAHPDSVVEEDTQPAPPVEVYDYEPVYDYEYAQ